MYPGIVPGSIIGSDAVGVIGSDVASFKQGQRVLINPGTGWDKDPRAPEGTYRILGLLPCIGKCLDYKVALAFSLFV
jgi:NADPH:quinone reductase-like Zn-dependent oxidoreductase